MTINTDPFVEPDDALPDEDAPAMCAECGGPGDDNGACTCDFMTERHPARASSGEPLGAANKARLLPTALGRFSGGGR